MTLKYWCVFAAVLYAGQWLIITGEESEITSSAAPNTTEEQDYTEWAPVKCYFTNSSLGLVAPYNCSPPCFNGTWFNAPSPDNASCLLNPDSLRLGATVDVVEPYNCTVGLCNNGTCGAPTRDAQCW
uniref:Evasin n=1 Tax=Rhipicephalus appendiculatus TaxID=34631 RepID=A0A131Z586_RHIAP